MRIAIPVVSLKAQGGVRLLVEISGRMSESGHEVAFFVPRGRFDSPFRIEVPVHEVPSLDYIRTMRKWHPDVILYNFFLTTYLRPFFRNVKGVYFVQDYEADFYSRLHPFHHMARLSYSFPIPKIATSRWLASITGAQKVVYPGINLEVFRFQPSRPWRKRILMFPRRHKHKGPDRILRIAPFLREKGYHLMFVTRDSNLRKRLEVFGEVFAPFSDEELVELYHSANVLLYTSKMEAFGLPLFEAMATGTPFITSHYPVLDELIPDRLREFVLKQFDEENVLRLLRRLEDEDFRMEAVRKGRSLVEERYNLKRFLDEFYDVFMNLIR